MQRPGGGMVDTLVLEASDESRGGSSPLPGTKHSTLPWEACHDGDCKCGFIWSIPDDNEVLTVTVGDWGDSYPALRPTANSCSLNMQVEAYMELDVHGTVPPEQAAANAKLIVKAVNTKR